uniref:Sucrose:sucrose 1-fructosyltransferase n=1 Tax=Festuca arundinacea TaxID=4606 RepID=SST_FESAR|nr:RecName: Full=Sucrose:sucrose 1-fructosyltransferase; AltName: Full=Sucrose 1(F)-fructosyltransferase; AltName: Full=Sucrose:sucrose 1(F)-beta-D-fructosyltransferase; Flags: Precursor [Lolium arundinaceum]CAC05261.1 sucrose:sucrose 1-fructosyltransferase [Lolium arundinaceum]
MESSAVVPGTTAPLLPYAYAPLPSSADDARENQSSGGVRWRVCAAVLAASALAVLIVVGLLAGGRVDRGPAGGDVASAAVPAVPMEIPRSRGKDFGVSEKASGAYSADGGFPWSNAMLQWQRTGFHFQPEKHYMNDPNGPVYYGGWYHLFYQYNPKGDSWGNIAWAHAVSKDMVNWRHLPLAMVPDQWYDSNGVLTGSITVLPDGQVILLYTGNTDTLAQVQCLATPADPSDPLLREWIKHPANPILYPPPGIGLKDFRDPLTAWFDHSDNTWRTVIGSKDDDGHAGIILSYKTKDFVNYELMPGNMHRGPDGTGMYECIDLYPVGGNSSEMLGGDDSPDVLFVLKESSDDERHDYYALGRFDAAANIWTPIDQELDLGIGLRYDWGKYYASKSFYDQKKNRRIVWAYIGETDSEQADITKGWANLMTIPRTVELDKKTRTNLIQWPVEELDTLRRNSTDLSGITVDAGSVIRLPLHQGAQIDIEASFQLNSSDVDALTEADVSYNCSTSGAAVRGALGPFGLLVLANGRTEQTAVYFYVSKGVDGALQTHFCHDESRSTQAKDVVNRMIGSIVPVLDGETFSVRVLVDHSIVQSFAMGGRITATSRAYPTEAIYAAAGVYLFNNATGATVTAERLVVYEMASADNHIFTNDDL